MNLLNRLTIKNLKLNKKRTIVTVIGIILSVALITAVASMYVSLIATMIRYETTQKGNFHTAFYNVPQSEIGIFTNNRAIEEIYVTQNIGYAKIEDSKNEYKPYAYVKSFTKSALENLSIRLVSGRLPENTSEIVIPTHLKTNGRVTLNVGDDITLNIGKRVDESGYELNQNTAFITDGEKIIETAPVTYKIVGIIERPASNIESYSAPGYTFITCDDNMNGTVDVFAKFTKENVKNAYKITADILGVDENLFESFNKSKVATSADFSAYNEEMKHAKYDTGINTYLISLQTNPISDNSIGNLGAVVVVVCVIIIVTSVFCIKNSFDISITEKTKQYGILRSIGATKKQIKKNVFYEATILGLIGIPLGILSGFFASYVLIIICNYLLVDIVAFGSTMIFEFSWWAVLAAFVLGTITIYFSALRSARRAAKVSPIDSIRNSGNIKIKPKKLRSPKIINKIFGIGGEISYKNLKRNKKKYRTTVISIIVSVSVFIALYYFMSLAFKTVDYEINAPDYNLCVSMRFEDGNAAYDNVLDITKLNNIENYTIRRSCRFDIESPRYSKDAESKNYAQGNGTIYLVSVGEEQYIKYIKRLGLNYEDVKNKGILVDYIKMGEYDEEAKETKYKYFRLFDYKKEENISGQIKSEDDLTLEIGYTTDLAPFALKDMYNAQIIISDELMNKIANPEIIQVYIKSNNAIKLQDDIEALNIKSEGLSLVNNEEEARMMNNIFILIAIFLYGFITVITLIGITNIFNTITTNMELRRQEFAMLKSIGMTKREFNRMIRLESIFMGTKSLIFGVPIGIGLSYLIYLSVAINEDMGFKLPIFAIIMAICAVFILIFLLMRYSINKINKQNTIETIRNENI